MIQIILVQRKLVEVMRQQLNYSIHEIPSGVLYGINGASSAECQALLEEVDEFRQLAQNTQLLEQYEPRIQEWEYYFKAYADYLAHRTDYNGFPDYL